jgi:hypothetical protein
MSLDAKHIENISKYLKTFTSIEGINYVHDSDILALSGDKYFNSPLMEFSIGSASVTTVFAPKVSLSVVGNVKADLSNLRSVQSVAAYSLQGVLDKLVNDGVLSQENLEDIEAEPVMFNDTNLVGYSIEFQFSTQIGYFETI